MDIYMNKDVNNNYIYNPKKSQKDTTEDYDGRYNAYFYNPNNVTNQNINKYNEVNNKNRKVEPIIKQNKYNNLEEENKYKKIDIWV